MTTADTQFRSEPECLRIKDGPKLVIPCGYCGTRNEHTTECVQTRLDTVKILKERSE